MEKEWPSLSLEERDRRWKLIREAMKKEGIDCLILYAATRQKTSPDEANIRYVTNYGCGWGGDSYSIFPLEGKPALWLWLDPSLARFAKRYSWAGEVEVGFPVYAKKIANKIKSLKLEKKTIGIVGNDDLCQMRQYPNIYPELIKELPQAKFKHTFLLQEIRVIKSQEEIRFLEKSAELGDIAMEKMEKVAKPGIKEYELHAAIEHAMLSHGGDHPSFIILSSGPAIDTDWVFPHWGGANRTLRNGDIILNELGPSYGGYHTQCARPISLGEPPKLLRQMYDAGAEVYNIIAKMLGPGVNLQDIDKAVYKPIQDADLDWEVTPGHGLGLSCCEQPILGLGEMPGVEAPPTPPTKLKPGMNIVNHPHITSKDGKAGMLLGDQYVVTETGCRNLNKYPLKFIII